MERDSSNRSGRAAFGALYLESLTRTAQLRLDVHDRHEHRLRARLAARRLRALNDYSALRRSPHAMPSTAAPRVAFAIASIALAVSVGLGLLAAQAAQDSLVLSLADVGMVVLAALWFALGVACVTQQA